MMSVAEPHESDDRYIFRGVTVVDTRDGMLAHDMAVVTEHKKIVRIVAAANVTDDRSATTVDARGKYLVPGYNDFHAHPLGSTDPEGSLTLLLASGITGFRELASQNAMLEQCREGTLVPDGMPELLEIGSEPLTPGNAATPEAAVAHVNRQRELGADFIKIMDYSPPVFSAIARECARLGMRFLGHLSPTVAVRAAAKAGMTSIEHMGPRDSILLGCSTDETVLRPVAASPGATPSPRRPEAVSTEVIARMVALPTVTTSSTEFARYRRVIDTYDDERMEELAAHFVAAGTWQVPTLIRVRTMQIGDDPQYRNDPNLQYVPGNTTDMWQDMSQQFARFSSEERATLRQLYELSARIVKPLKKAGVNMLAGSDLSGGFIVPGFGLHQEFDLLKEAGLEPLDALQMTTLDGARFLGREATMGSVAEGKDANLVLLDADPMASVANLHRIAGVMCAGTYYSAAALASMKQRTADRVAANR